MSRFGIESLCALVAWFLASTIPGSMPHRRRTSETASSNRTTFGPVVPKQACPVPGASMGILYVTDEHERLSQEFKKSFFVVVSGIVRETIIRGCRRR